MKRFLFAALFLLLGQDAFADCDKYFSFGAVKGAYEIDLTIGAKMFHDKLRVTEVIPDQLLSFLELCFRNGP